MRIRITGTEPDTRAAADRIARVLNIREVSRFYRTRNSITGTGRLYLDADLPHQSTVEVIVNDEC